MQYSHKKRSATLHSEGVKNLARLRIVGFPGKALHCRVQRPHLVGLSSTKMLPASLLNGAEFRPACQALITAGSTSNHHRCRSVALERFVPAVGVLVSSEIQIHA